MSANFPIVDVSPWMRDDSHETARNDVVAQIGAACETIGFFALTGHGISRSVITELTDQAYRFFDLPLEEKLKVKRPRPEQNRGYIPSGDERLARLAGNETPPDLKELFTIGPFDLPDTPYYTGRAAYPSFAANLWPENPVGLQPALRAYWREVERLAQTLCRIFAAALDLKPDFFDSKTDRHISQLRLMHYPPPETPPLPGQLRAGAHSDLGMMTLLWSDNDIGGLEVMDRADRWVPVPPIEGAFTINLGDLMMRWTNDRWRSTPHRVVNPPEAAHDRSRRLSIGMFFIPNYDAEVAPLTGGFGAAHYPPTTVAGYRTARFASTAGAYRD